MAGMIDREEARALVANGRLWPLVRDFLWNFPSQVHESWLVDDEKPGDQMPRISQFMASPHVRRFVLSSLGIEPCWHSFPAEDESRLLLLDGGTLESVAKWLGAIAGAASLRQVTSGDVVRELRANLAGIYPDVFGYTAYFRDIGRDDAFAGVDMNGRSLSGVIYSLGFHMLNDQLANLPKPLAARFKYKFPKAVAESAAPCEVKASAASVRLLLKLRFPEAYRTCCS